MAGAAATVPYFPRAFLPAFNEGSVVLGLSMQPGTSLAEANRIGSVAETLIRALDELRDQYARRSNWVSKGRSRISIDWLPWRSRR